MAKTHHGYLLIADITGYTMYLSQSELEHAQETLSTLLELLVEHTRPPLVLSRLAGDAVVSYGLRDNFIAGQTFLEMIEDTYVAFRKAIDQMVLNNTCRCNACANVSTLDLKFFVHYGAFAIQNLGSHEELVGSDVNLIHRLLKNHVVEKTGFRAYTLYTDAAIRQLGIADLSQTMTAVEETYEHLGTVHAWVQDMHPVWEQKKSALQVTVPPEQVIIEVETEVGLPREIVWDFLASPDHRNVLMGSDRQIAENLVHGRVAEGTIYQCYHGKKRTSLVVLEWQPFERLLLESETPIPWTTTLMGLHLNPSPGGVCLKKIITKSKGPLLARLICDMLIKGMRNLTLADLVKFKDHIEATHAKREQE